MDVFTFDELSPDAQEEALEYQRVRASEDDFWKEDYMLFEGREMNGVEAAEKMCLGILRRKRESKEEEEDLGFVSKVLAQANGGIHGYLTR